MKRHGFLLVGVTLSVVLLAWTLHGLHLEELARALSGLKIPWLLIGALFYFVAVILRTWRWGILLRGLQSTGFQDRFIALTIGYMGNNLYPARAGELLRAYVLQRRCGVRVSTALGTIVVERVLDGLMVVFLALVALLFFPLPASLRSAVMAGGAVFGGALLMLLGMARNATRLHDLLERTSRHRLGLRMERAMAFLSRFLDGLTVLRHPAHALAVGGLTALIWLAEAGTYSLVMQAFLFELRLFPPGDDRDGQPGHGAPIGPGLCGHLRGPGGCRAPGVWDPCRCGFYIHAAPPPGSLAAHHTPWPFHVPARRAPRDSPSRGCLHFLLNRMPRDTGVLFRSGDSGGGVVSKASGPAPMKGREKGAYCP